ncbi:MAG: ROK family protein [Candidatus Limnocylindrales bacterium]
MNGRGVRSRHLGIDLGATNLKWALVERVEESWRTVDRGHEPTLAADGPDAVIQRLIGIGRRAIGDSQGPPVASIGIGVPGLYDPATGVTRFLVNVPGAWRDQPVAGPLETALGLPTGLINDARAFGLAELRLGAGRGARTLIGLTLGTGVGGVVAVDGRVLLGHDGTAGEIGHQTIDPDGPPCGCGNHGCLEAFARADRIADACGTETAEAAIEAARAGDAAALSGLERIGTYLGIGVANMIVVLSPDRVVIGGGIAAAGDLLLVPIRAEIERRVRTTSLAPVGIVTAELGTWAGAIGAAIHGAEATEAPRAVGVAS